MKKRVRKKNSIFSKMFVGIILVVAAVLGVYYAFTIYYEYSVNAKEVFEESKDLSVKINHALKDYTTSIDGTISSIYYELYQNDKGPLALLLTHEEEISGVEKLEINKQLNRFFSQQFLMEQNFIDLYIYADENHIYQYSTYGGATINYSPKDKEWYQNTLQKGGKTEITLGYIPEQITYQKPVIGFSRVIRNMAEEGIIENTVIMLDFSINALEELIGNYITNDYTTVFLEDEEGNIIYQQGAEIAPASLDELDFIENSPQVQKLNGKKFLISSSNTRVNDWKVYIVTDYRFAMRAVKDFLWVTVILAVGAILIAVIIAYFFSKFFLYPIMELEKGMEKIRKGNFDIHLEKKRDDELGSLIDSFNLMADKTKNMIKEKYEEELEKKEAQYQFLQAQINPHFIFNTLQIISSMAMVYKRTEIATVSNSLARLIRYSIDGDSKVISIMEEAANVKSYLEIQRIRFQNRFSYEIIIPEEMNSITIVKLVLQPIVENAICHGIESMDSMGNILIKGEIHGDEAELYIRDNGVGMREEELARLLESINRKETVKEKEDLEAKKKGNNVGLRNINLRLKMYYGEEYGLHIHSVQGEGTEVVIRIPFEKEACDGKTADCGR